MVPLNGEITPPVYGLSTHNGTDYGTIWHKGTYKIIMLTRGYVPRSVLSKVLCKFLVVTCYENIPHGWYGFGGFCTARGKENHEDQ